MQSPQQKAPAQRQPAAPAPAPVAVEDVSADYTLERIAEEERTAEETEDLLTREARAE